MNASGDFRPGEVFSLRLCAFLGLIMVALAFLAVSLWNIQVARGARYDDDLARQSIRRVRLPGIRGMITDRNQQVLADNRASYDVALYLEEVRQPGPWTRTIDHVEAIIADLSRILLLEPEVTREDIQNHRLRRLPLPLTLWKDVSESTIARLVEQGSSFPGVDLTVQAVRAYPQHQLACHALGYVGRMDPPKEDEPYHYYLPEMEGKAGVERQFDPVLRGEAGGRLLRVDVSGYRRNDLGSRPPARGRDVRLALDLDIQAAAARALGEMPGAVVVLDPNNGDVLALVSSPGYDLNTFIPSISVDAWKALLEDEQTPLLNRAIAGGYPPGSTFKPITALAAFNQGRVPLDRVYSCNGSIQVGNAVFRCGHRSGHGTVGLEKALEGSCNVYFYDLGMDIGIDPIAHMAYAMGLGAKTGIALDGEVAGLVPDRAWKLRTLNDGWRDGDTCNVSIGQGALVVTPLQMACITAVIANGGTLYRPRIALGTYDAENQHFQAIPPEVLNRVTIDPPVLRAIREGMRLVVMSPTGTGRNAQVPGVSMAGKTGTAEFGPREARRKHAWMIAYVPFEAPRYAIAMLVDEGLSGGTTVGPRLQALVAALFAPGEGAG
ncbi:MAG: penicillin-binding protein 2 [Kiritimatiellae bacterium]|nr:penicillin-binding protein 2 [Kiritimatiellia bacterium]